MDLAQIIASLLVDKAKLNAEELAVYIKKLKLHPNYPIILVGGTNGKGSVCAMLSSIFSSGGYKTGLYTSPHILRYNERICINDTPIDDNDLQEALMEVNDASTNTLGLFTTFTLASHLIFMKKQIDIAIIEVGIGGRMDITNMFEPDISVITSIGLDHCQILGNTIEEIAKEKSAIFRPQKPCFYGSHPPPHSLTEYAANIGAKLQVLGKEFNYHPHTDNFTVTTAKRSYYGLPYPNLRGTIQLANAATALAVIDELHQNFPVSIQHIKSGLLNIHLNGRFQVLPGSPLTVLDVAHNPHAVANMVKNMLKLPFTAKTVAVFGVAKDKDVEGIASLCKDSFDLWFIAKINSARGMDVADIADILSKMGINQQNIIPCINCAAAYEKASLVADAKIICFGSFLVVEEILRK